MDLCFDVEIGKERRSVDVRHQMSHFPLVFFCGSWCHNPRKRYPKEMYRMKGILDVKGIDERYVFHAVNCHFGGTPQGHFEEARESKAVFIGKGIDHVWLIERLRDCFTDPKSRVLESNVKAAHA